MTETTETEKDLATILADEAELFDAEDDDDVAEAVWVRPAPPRDPSQVYSIRIPVTEVEKLRQVAEHRGVTPSALMRSWMLIRLEAEYEAMLGICPRCGRPAPAAGHTDEHGKLVSMLAESGTRKATTRARAPARKAAAAARKFPAKAAPKAAAAKKAAPRKATKNAGG